MRFKLGGDSREFEVEVVSHEGKTLRARVGDEEITAEMEMLPEGGALLTIDGRRVRIFGARLRGTVMVAAGPSVVSFIPVEGRSGHLGHGLATPEISAPMPGKVLTILVAEGQAVVAGQPLIVLEAMKMETTLSAESDAVVKKVNAEVGAMVEHGAVLIELSPTPGSSESESQSQDE